MKVNKVAEILLAVVLVTLAIAALGQLVVDAVEDILWGPNEQVTPADTSGAQPIDLAVDDHGNAYAIWQGYEYYQGYDWTTYLSVRPSDGTWTMPEELDLPWGQSSASDVAVAVDAVGNLYSLWTDRDEAYRYDIYFCVRPPHGVCSTPIKVTDVGDDLAYWSFDPDITVDSSGNAYAIWVDRRNGNRDIYFSERPAHGIWSANVQITDDLLSADQSSPAIAVDPDGSVYAVWIDSRYDTPDVFFSLRPIEGDWSSNVRVNDDFGTGWPYQSDPDIAVDASGNAYAIWTDTRNWGVPDIYFSFRPAGGSWGANVQVDSGAGTARQSLPEIAVDDIGYAYAIWRDSRYTPPDIYSSVRTPDGEWGTNVRVNDDLGWANQDSPNIVVDTLGNVYAIWQDMRTNTAQICSSSSIIATWPHYVYLPCVLRR